MQWTYADEANQQHPIDEGEFPSLIASGRISRETLVWNESMPDWQACGNVRPDLFGEIISTPPALTPAQRKQAHLQSVEAANGIPPTDGVAICSMIFGILGLITCVVILSIPAVVCGHIGLKKANANPGNPNNRGFSITGLITGYIGIAFLLLFLVYMALIFIIGVSGAMEATDFGESFNGE